MFESVRKTVPFLAIFVETLNHPNADVDNLDYAGSDSNSCEFRHGVAGKTGRLTGDKDSKQGAPNDEKFIAGSANRQDSIYAGVRRSKAVTTCDASTWVTAKVIRRRRVQQKRHETCAMRGKSRIRNEHAEI